MNENIDGLKFEQVEINFIYSFFISKANTIHSTKREFNDILRYIKFKKRKRDNKGKDYIRMGIPPNLRVRNHEFYKHDKFGYISEIKRKGYENYYKPKDGHTSLDVFTRIMETGIGTITFRFILTNYKHKIEKGEILPDGNNTKLNTKDYINSKDIYKFYDLINGADNTYYKYPRIVFSNDRYPYSEKNKESTTKGKRIKDIINEFKGDLKIAGSSDKKNSKTIPIHFLDEIIIDNHESKLDEQNPYVVLTGKLTSDSNNWVKNTSTKDSKNDKVSLRNLHEINLLLFRYIKGSNLLKLNKLDNLVYTSYTNPKMQNYLKDYSWFKNMFVASHPRTTLILYQDINIMLNNNEDAKEKVETTKSILNFVKHSTLDLFELVRMRWHFSVVINEILDNSIRELTSGVNNKSLENSILINRQMYAEFLSDPLTYSFGGALVFDLIESAKNHFQLDYLKKTTEMKLNVYDQLFVDYIDSKY